MKRRHVLAVLGLSFVTLGIYVIYWLYKTRKELLNYLPDKNAIPRVIIMFIPVFVMVIALIVSAVVSFSFAASGGMDNEALANTISALTMIIFMLSILACFIVSFWWFYKYFKAVEAVVQGNDAMLLYVVWIVLTLVGFGPIWTVVVQNDLNKFIDNGYRPLKMPPHPGHHAPYPQQPQYGQPYPPQAPQPYAPQPPQPYQTPTQHYGPPQPYQQQPYPAQAPQQHPHHVEHGQQHPHQQHHAHQDHGHYNHPDQSNDGQGQPPHGQN